MKAYSFITVCIFILFSSKEVKPSKMSEEDSSSEETFLYFAYGSNLLAKRIHINNPSAKFFSIAKLPGNTMRASNYKTVYILILLSKEVKPSTSEEDSSSEETFLYFAYGSNLLAKRIHINNPSAKFYSIAKLANFRLDFDYDKTFDNRFWNGAFATIVDDTASVVWGALWTLQARDIPHLDKQEGVDVGAYKVRDVTVYTPEGKTLKARTYQITVDPPKVPSKCLPPERQPSDTYMKVILYGAFECLLPMHYIGFLFTFPTNGKLAGSKALNLLGYPFDQPDPT